MSFAIEERKKSHEQFWIRDQEKREFVNPENGVRASEKFAKTEKVSERVKKSDNTRSPRTVNINRSGIVRTGDSSSSSSYDSFGGGSSDGGGSSSDW